MSIFDTLPVLLVSAVNESVATSVILELIDNDVTEEYIKGDESCDRVWRLDNKYYSADVRVHALTDEGVLTISPNLVEAHIIHISKEEVSEGGVAAAERRAARGAGAWARCYVRVALAPCAQHDALDAWCLTQRADLVPLREAPAQPHEPFAARGPQRARALLHAHAWSGLRRKDGRFPAPPPRGEGDESESGEEESEEEAVAVERAEAFAAALGALHALPPRPAARAERLQRAEDLVTAFCRALGLDPDAPQDRDVREV